MINKDSHTEMKVRSSTIQCYAISDHCDNMVYESLGHMLHVYSKAYMSKEVFETEDKDTAFYSNER
jgi:hypothetical protein